MISEPESEPASSLCRPRPGARSRLIAAAVLLGSLVLAPAARAAEPGGRTAMPAAHSGPQGYLGIDVRDVGEDQINTLHLKDPHGAVIVRVDHDGPAGKMGLREHDVVLQMNGSTVDGEETLRRMLRESPPGRTVTLLISRDGQQLTVTAQMADRDQVERDAWNRIGGTVTAGSAPGPGPQAPASGLPTGDGAAQSAAVPSAPTTATPGGRYSRGFLGSLLMSPSYTGAMLEKMSPQLSGFFGVQGGSGLLVRSVEPDSPAAQAGMRAGDVVTRANLLPVNSTSDWARIIKEAKGRPVTVTLLRDKTTRTVTLTPDGKRRSELSMPELAPGNASSDQAAAPAPEPQAAGAIADGEIVAVRRQSAAH